jgi:hypothetical protein
MVAILSGVVNELVADIIATLSLFGVATKDVFSDEKEQDSWQRDSAKRLSFRKFEW